MNLGWVLECIGLGLMAGGALAYQQGADPDKVFKSLVGGLAFVLIGSILDRHMSKEENAYKSNRNFSQRLLPPKKRQWNYRRAIRLMTILGPLIGLMALGILASLLMFGNTPIMEGRF